MHFPAYIEAQENLKKQRINIQSIRHELFHQDNDWQAVNEDFLAAHDALSAAELEAKSQW